MKFSKLFLVALTSSVFFVSCSSDDNNSPEIPLGVYDNGILILNEGNASSGSISFITDDLQTINQDIFSGINPDQELGGFVQSMFFDGDRAFIISNASNKITVVNRYTFEFIASIDSGFTVPRYGVVANGKAYVTNLNTFTSLTDDFVTVINLSNLTTESTIPVNGLADKIFTDNGKLYVANGSFGEGSSLTVINLASQAIESTIDVGIAPNSLEEENGILYVLCANYVDDSKLVKINLATNQKITEIEMSGLVNAQNLNLDNSKMYFTVDSGVYSADLSATTISSAPLFTSQATTLYGFNVEQGRIYVADAKDYASDGEVFIYDASGILQRQFNVGLVPNGFYIND